MRTEPLPLLLLTGFLGSGKTSTLRHWLKETKIPLQRTAVIINDFGAVNVDAALLAQRQLELRSITGGCVCCQSFEDLVEQALTLSQNQELDLVWIETSGLADPEEVFDHLSGPELQDKAIVRRLILVVDGTDFPCSWRGRAVQEEQIRYADLILLNKVDRLKDGEHAEVESALRRINPHAQIVVTDHGNADPELLSGEGTSGLHAHHKGCADDCHDHDHEHHHHHHEEELPHAASTLFLPLKAAVSRGDFQRFLQRLPDAVFRAKGFVRFTDAPGQLHTFQQVRDQSELVLLPLEEDQGVSAGLVLIGPHLDELEIRRLAEESLASAVSQP